jgi:predicted AAA+ superfamily ATPase
MKNRLDAKLAPIVVVRGPRQIGKTTAQLQLLEDYLEVLPPRQVLRVQWDELPSLRSIDSEPLLRVVEWYERTILGESLNDAARSGRKTLLLFDEVQNLTNWAPQLKHLVDSSTTQVLVTGSSALRIEQGRDSLAGRISTIEAGVLSLSEVAAFHGLPVPEPVLGETGIEPVADLDFWRDVRSVGARYSESRDLAFDRFSERGGYPLVHERKDVPWELVAEQLNETVIRRVIQHDLRVGERGRKRDAPLLEEVFRLACRYVGQSPAPSLFAREAQRALNANVGPKRVTEYLRFLGDTLLLRLIPPLEIRLKRSRGNAKVCLADHGLRASWLQEVVPVAPRELAKAPHLAPLAGHVAESIVGAALSTIPGMALSHYPERGGEPEVDFVISVGATRIPLEVKYTSHVDAHRDTEGLRSFIEKTHNNAPFGLLVCQSEIDLPDPRIVAIPLATLMLLP